MDEAAWSHTLREGAEALGVRLTKLQAGLCLSYARLVLEWNQKTNLTSITSLEAMAVLHFLDSLAAVPLVAGASSLLDIGTGAGFPGLVIQIAQPKLQVVLADSVRKKVSFLEHAIGVLGLAGAKAVHGRAEDLAARPDMAQGFDLVAARAVADLSKLWDLAKPFLAGRGALLAMKGKDPAKEIQDLQNAARARGLPPPGVDVISYSLPGVTGKRHLVRVGPSLVL